MATPMRYQMLELDPEGIYIIHLKRQLKRFQSGNYNAIVSFMISILLVRIASS